MNGVVQASIPTIHGLYDQYGSLFATDGTREIYRKHAFLQKRVTQHDDNDLKRMMLEPSTKIR